MSLERFLNRDDFLIGPETNTGVMPNKWTDTLRSGGQLIKYPINFSFLSSILKDITTEAHFYDVNEGDYVTSIYGLNTFINPNRKREPKSLNTINIPTNEIIPGSVLCTLVCSVFFVELFVGEFWI